MSFKQKYTVVQFIKPVRVGTKFTMDEWPAHITIADTFAANIDNTLTQELGSFLAPEKNFVVKAGQESILGDANNPTRVVLIENSIDLQSLHNKLIHFLELRGAVFNSPEFTRKGFLPHCTFKNTPYLKKGELVKVHELSLIDLFVNGDWKLRKVLRSTEMQANEQII
jgi:hypothetical protein